MAPAATCSFNLNYTNTADAAGTLNVVLPFAYSDKVFNANLSASYYTYSSANLLLANGVEKLFFNNLVNNGLVQESQLISVYNTGTATASNVLFNISGSNPSNVMAYTTTGVNSPCGATLAAGATCFVKATFGPTTQSVTQSAILNNLNVNYIPELNKGVTISTTKLSGNIVDVHAANLRAVLTSNTFVAGSGSVESALLVEQNVTPLPTVTYTVTNSAAQATGIANKLTVTLADPNWIMTNNACNNVTLNPGGTCTFTFALNSTANIGAVDLDLSNITIAYTNADDQSDSSQTLNGLLSTTVVPTATIVINGSGVGFQAATDGSFLVESNTINTLTFKLVGGMSASSYLITPTISNGTGSATFSGPNTCTVSSANPVCTLQLATNANNFPGSADFSVSFVSSPLRVITPSAMQFHTWTGYLPFSSGFQSLNVAGATRSNYLYFGALIKNNLNKEIYKCSILSNGKIYTCLNFVISTLPPADTISYNYITFNGNYAYLYYYAGTDAYASPLTTSVIQCNVDVNGNFNNCSNPISLTGAPFNNESGIYGGSVYSNGNISTAYFVSNGLWQCFLTNHQFTLNNCSLASTPGINFVLQGSMSVSGNSLYVVQGFPGKGYFLVKCAINSDTGAISNCEKVTPTDTVENNFTGNGYAGSMMIYNNYLYVGSYKSFGVSLSNLSSSSTIFLTPDVGVSPAMIPFNNYLYIGIGKYFTQNTDGTLVNKGSSVGY